MCQDVDGLAFLLPNLYDMSFPSDIVTIFVYSFSNLFNIYFFTTVSNVLDICFQKSHKVL